MRDTFLVSCQVARRATSLGGDPNRLEVRCSVQLSYERVVHGSTLRRLTTDAGLAGPESMGSAGDRTAGGVTSPG
jgi:hypothetical protein